MAVEILGRRIPAYDLLLIAIGPLVLLAMWLLLTRTRWARWCAPPPRTARWWARWALTRAKLFTSVMFVGALLAGLGGALQIPREPANLELDLSVIADAFVVTVVGGLGSIGGAFLAAMLIGVAKAFCIGLGTVHWFGVEIAFSKLTLVVEFLIMAIVLVIWPFGLLGKPQAAQRLAADAVPPLSLPSWSFALAWLALLVAMPLLVDRYVTILATDIFCFALFAASLHFIMGPAGMVSFGHAAYFGLGAYAAGLLLKNVGLPMEAALVLAPLAAGAFAVVYGWFCVRLSGVYLAMLTLAFAQISWSIVFQWDSVTGGSNACSASGRPPGWRPRPSTTISRWRCAVPASRCCGAPCSRPSAMSCAPAAIRRCAPKRSASTCAAINGWRSCWPAPWPASPVRSTPSPRAASRPPPSRSPVDRRAGHGAAGRRRYAHRAAGWGRDLHLAARRGRPPHRVLARRHRPGDPGDRPAVSAGLVGGLKGLALRWREERA